jgi:hypothetical protein
MICGLLFIRALCVDLTRFLFGACISAQKALRIVLGLRGMYEYCTEPRPIGLQVINN